MYYIQVNKEHKICENFYFSPFYKINKGNYNEIF